MSGTMISFSSQQVLPNYIAAMQLQPDRVAMLTTEDYDWVPNLLERHTGIPHTRHFVRPYNFAENARRAHSILSDVGADAPIRVNFTGGTKIMALAGTLSALSNPFRERASAIYVDTINNQIIETGTGKDSGLALSSETITVTIPFEKFVSLAREEIREERLDCAAEESRRRMSARLASQLKLAGLMNGKLQEKLKADEEAKKTSGRIEIPGKAGGAGWTATWEPGVVTLALPGGESVRFAHSKPLSYLRGGWLEEYVGERLRTFARFDQVKEGVILKLRNPVKLRNTTIEDKNELDVVATSGTRAAIIECKAGSVKQDQVHKLAALRDHLLGPFGLAVLACRFKPAGNTAHIIERARDNNILLVAGDELSTIGEQVFAEMHKGA